MRRPPSPAQLPAYPVAGGVSLMSIAVTVMTRFGHQGTERLEMGPTAFHGEPWRLVTSALPHLDPVHLIFDVYWFWVLGTLLEEVFGHARLLALVVLFAAGSAAAEYAFTVGGLGLSGVTYGLFGLLWILSRTDRRFKDAVDARTTQLMVFWFFLCIVLTVQKVWEIANFAHGVGGLLGLLVGAAISARGVARRALAAVGALLLLAASFAGATVLRPRVNMVHDGHGSAQLGYQAIQEGRLDDAIRYYRDSIAMNPRSATPWYNLGIAYENAGRADESVDAFRRSFEIDTSNSMHRRAYLNTSRRYAAAAQEKGDHARTIALLRPVVEADPSDAATWFFLAHSYHALGKTAEEAEARARAASLSPGTAP